MSKEDTVLNTINEWSATTIKQIRLVPELHLIRMISGQLRTTILAHGPITENLVGSASKRIASQLLANLREKKDD